MSVKWIEHRGKRILYCDFRGERGDKIIEDITTMIRLVNQTPGQVLIFNNAEGIWLDPKVMGIAKQAGRDALEPKTAKSAVTGVTGAKATLLQIYNSFTGGKMRPFNTETEALDYLAQ